MSYDVEADCVASDSDLDALEQAIEELCASEIVAKIRERKSEIQNQRTKEDKIKNIIYDMGMHDGNDVVGFTKIKNFEGKRMYIGFEYLKKVFGVLDAIGIEPSHIDIGIAEKEPGNIFLVFLDNTRTTALCVAGIVEE